VTHFSIERLRREGQAFMEELAREYYLSGAGLKTSAELQPIYARHAAVAGEDAFGFVREQFLAATPGSEEHRQLRILVEGEAELQSSRELAAVEDREITWEASAKVKLSDARELEFQRVPIVIAQAADFRERHQIEDARNTLVAAELAPMRGDRLEREREITEKLGLAASYNATFELMSGVQLTDVAAQCERFLAGTRALWDDVFPRFVRNVLGMDAGDATRADALALFQAKAFDGYFPSNRMEPEIRRQVGEMGIDPVAGGRVLYDTDDRPAKRSRAFCAAVRIPAEVYLVLRPHSGQSDWNTFLHELGHSLHFAYMDASLPFEYRWLGDNSITEGYAMLFDHLMHDAGWLKRYTPLSKAKLDEFLRANAFFELHMLRRYAAKLLYEVELHGGKMRRADLPALYVEHLTGATTFRYNGADAFVDVDPRFYAARYLQAWQLQSLLTETLVDRFNEDWWRNPSAGPWIVAELFSHGQRELAGEQAKRVTGKTLSFDPLVRFVERALG
jgi:hypothetical protein